LYFRVAFGKLEQYLFNPAILVLSVHLFRRYVAVLLAEIAVALVSKFVERRKRAAASN